MGPVFADITGNGLLDLWVSDAHYNRLMKNNGKGGFDDIGIVSGLSQANAQYVSWGTGVYDFDNDGWLDIMVFHGGLIQMIPQEHSVFRGLGGGRFEDVSATAGPSLSLKTVARGACFADYDNDGKVDAFVVNLNGRGELLHNLSTGTGHWIAIQLKGARTTKNSAGSNRDGIGARVEVWAGGRKQVAERVASSGYLSQDDGRLHFGLGVATKVDKVVVDWPSGREQTVEGAPVDRVLTIEEPQ
jgi:hypothetical protein